MPLRWTKADGSGSELFGDEPQAVPRQSAVVMMPEELSQCRSPPWRRWSLFLLVCLSCVFFLSCQQSALFRNTGVNGTSEDVLDSAPPFIKAFSIVKLGFLQNSNYKDWPFPLDICREDIYKLNWEQGGGHRPNGLSNQGIT